jgi:hypothetical protein
MDVDQVVEATFADSLLSRQIAAVVAAQFRALTRTASDDALSWRI